MPETTPLIKAALNLRGGAGFDVYVPPICHFHFVYIISIKLLYVNLILSSINSKHKKGTDLSIPSHSYILFTISSSSTGTPSHRTYFIARLLKME